MRAAYGDDVSTAITLPGALLAAFVSLHVVTIVIAMMRCRTHARDRVSSPAGLPPVTIIRPVSGDEPFLGETLASTYALDYPNVEILFCAASVKDPAVQTVRALLAWHRGANARLLIGDDAISDNPKLNNVVKGWRAAANDLIIMADCNVLFPRDYVQRCLAAWDDRTGLVAAPPAGTRPENFAAEVEAAFLNTYQARWQYAANSIGFGFAQGKNLAFRRDLIENAGGVRALASELAEDAAATKIVRKAGYVVRLASGPFAQPIGRRSLRAMWSRQQRWARLRRMSFPACYALEIGSGVIPPMLVAAWWAVETQRPLFAVMSGLLLVWFGLEWALARIAGWPATWRSACAMALRDFMLPLLWIEGWRSADSSGMAAQWPSRRRRAHRDARFSAPKIFRPDPEDLAFAFLAVEPEEGKRGIRVIENCSVRADLADEAATAGQMMRRV